MGLHPLLSVFQTIDLHDVIQVAPSMLDQHVVEFDGLDVPAVNTCTAVIDALADQLQSFWTVTIKKIFLQEQVWVVVVTLPRY